MARFELTTPASRRQCSTRLSYTPTRGKYNPNCNNRLVTIEQGRLLIKIVV